MVFSTNQNRQLYVAKTFTEDTPASQGDVQVQTTANEKQVWFKTLGVGGPQRTDILDVDKIVYAKITKAADLALPLKQATITLNSDINDGAPVAGQDYILRIYIYNYLASGDDNVYMKYGVVHAYTGMDAATFYEVLADSLNKNFSRDVSKFFTIESSDSGVTITEVEQPWVLGTMAQEPVNFRVVAAPIFYEGDEVIWATTDDDGFIEITESGDTVKDGKRIADLEYFCHGERGDQYRNVGWPYVINTKYEVDPDDEYDVLDIHYSFTDTGVNNQASEKDLTFVASTSNNAVLTSILSQLEELGVSTEGEVSSSSES